MVLERRCKKSRYGDASYKLSTLGIVFVDYIVAIVGSVNASVCIRSLRGQKFLEGFHQRTPEDSDVSLHNRLMLPKTIL